MIQWTLNMAFFSFQQQQQQQQEQQIQIDPYAHHSNNNNKKNKQQSKMIRLLVMMLWIFLNFYDEIQWVLLSYFIKFMCGKVFCCCLLFFIKNKTTIKLVNRKREKEKNRETGIWFNYLLYMYGSSIFFILIMKKLILKLYDHPKKKSSYSIRNLFI